MERFVGPDAGGLACSCGAAGRQVFIDLACPTHGVNVAAKPTAPPLLAAAQAVCEAFPKTEPLTPRARALEDLRAAVASAQRDGEA